MNPQRIHLLRRFERIARPNWHLNSASVWKFGTVHAKSPFVSSTLESTQSLRCRTGSKAQLHSPWQSQRYLTQTADSKLGKGLSVTFVDREGKEHTISVAEGDNLLEIAQAKDLEVEGACGGSCACSTCHVIVLDGEIYGKLSEPTEDENDMLDQAEGLTDTSRLGCQVKMTKELNGLVVKLPAFVANMQASG